MADHPRDFASTPRVIQAADRVFTTVHLESLTRSEVIALLGDPKHRSRSMYNFPFYPVPRGTLVHRFDTGVGGLQFTFGFDRVGKVTSVTKRGIE